MRTGISITLKPSDRRRLKALARDRNAPHKHVWRAEIVLFSSDGIGTNEIMRRTGKSKTCVWRWQERFMQAGYESAFGEDRAVVTLVACSDGAGWGWLCASRPAR
jgi:DNA invertase Pin-like site-specific DNA recombinase